MSKHRYANVACTTQSALGDIHLANAITTIDRLCQCTVTALTEYPLTRKATIEALFTQDVLDRAVAAKKLIEPESYTIGYDLEEPGAVPASTELAINYRDSSYPPINEEAMVFQPASDKLFAFIAKIRAIHEQFEEFKATLRWLNLNATPGAIRFYFPTILALCPNSPPIAALQHVPTRYSNPENIGNWIPSIKDAAACYANTQLLPSTAKKRDRNEMWLTFRCYSVKRGDAIFPTDSRIYNL